MKLLYFGGIILYIMFFYTKFDLSQGFAIFATSQKMIFDSNQLVISVLSEMLIYSGCRFCNSLSKDKYAISLLYHSSRYGFNYTI